MTVSISKDTRQDVEAKLKKRQYRSAVLVCSVNLEIRLTTLLMRSLGITQRDMRERYKELFANKALGTLTKLSYSAGMIVATENRILGKFIELRNDIAHERWMWRNPPDSDMKKAIRYGCGEILNILEKTDKRQKGVRERSTRRKGERPSYLEIPW